ncbi:MAG: hypothetical protein A2051_01455 [Desulfovibrionales bacterium GWA2_65_9]|nr:MAG: hypothetical protein A2051_01455 [Desulfovibrionales bacterium GWA2_65_9]
MSKHRKLGPAAAYSHREHVVTNVNVAFRDTRTTGQRVADAVARIVGGWPFIICQSLLILLWIAANGYLVYQATTNPGYFSVWDPYPYILLNLVLSLESAYAGPIIMMSQNRQDEKDRLMAEQDYQVNITAEEEIKVIMAHLAHQDELILEILARLEAFRQAEASADNAE